MEAVTLPKEKMDYTIDLLITMTVMSLANTTGHNEKEMLEDFLCSKTGKALYDIDNRLWCTGPGYLEELYLEEKQQL